MIIKCSANVKDKINTSYADLQKYLNRVVFSMSNMKTWQILLNFHNFILINQVSKGFQFFYVKKIQPLL